MLGQEMALHTNRCPYLAPTHFDAHPDDDGDNAGDDDAGDDDNDDDDDNNCGGGRSNVGGLGSGDQPSLIVTIA